MVHYTKKLIEKGEERKRLTLQLADMVGKVADDIAQYAPEGSYVNDWQGKLEPTTNTPYGNGSLEVKRFTSVEGDTLMLSWRVRTNKEDKEEGGYIWEDQVITANVIPGDTFYLDEDVSTPIRVAPKFAYLDFANNLQKIIAAFESNIDSDNEQTIKAFDTFKEMAATGTKSE